MEKREISLNLYEYFAVLFALLVGIAIATGLHAIASAIRQVAEVL